MSLSLDTIDHQILAELQADAGQSLDLLADRIALSRNAIWRRIRRMEESGVIRARVALVDPARIGLPLSVFVMVRTRAHDRAWMDRFGTAVRALPQILGAHRVTGDLDYVLRVRVADMAAYDRFYKDLISLVDLSDVAASFVMEDIKDTTALPLPEPKLKP